MPGDQSSIRSVISQFACSLPLSSFSSIRPVSSISNLATTVPLIKESQVLGPKDIAEGMSLTSLAILRSHLSSLGIPACKFLDS